MDNVCVAYLSISDAKTKSYCIFEALNPCSKPPIPENREATFILFCIISHLSYFIPFNIYINTYNKKNPLFFKNFIKFIEIF